MLWKFPESKADSPFIAVSDTLHSIVGAPVNGMVFGDVVTITTSVFSSARTGTGSSSATTFATSPTPTQSSMPTVSTFSGSSTGFSKGAMAGSSIGAAIGAIGISALVLWLVVRYRRKSASKCSASRAAWPVEWREELPGLDHRFEMDPNAAKRVELGSNRFARTPELNRHQAPQELPSPEVS